MARYIDAVELVKAIEENQRNTEHHKDGHSKQIHVNEHRHFIKMVHEQPTADVAPRAEVEALLKENDRWMTEYAGFRAGVKSIIENAKQEVAREIFEEIDKRIDNIMVVASPNDCFITTFRKTMEKVTAEIEELKKKYTGSDL